MQYESQSGTVVSGWLSFAGGLLEEGDGKFNRKIWFHNCYFGEVMLELERYQDHEKVQKL